MVEKGNEPDWAVAFPSPGQDKCFKLNKMLGIIKITTLPQAAYNFTAEQHTHSNMQDFKNGKSLLHVINLWTATKKHLFIVTFREERSAFCLFVLSVAP